MTAHSRIWKREEQFSPNFALQRDRITVGYGRTDMGKEGRADNAVLAVDVGMCLWRTGAGRRFVLVFQRRLPFGIGLAAGWTVLQV